MGIVLSNMSWLQCIRVIWRVSYKRMELLTLRDYLGSPRFLVGSVLFIFVVLCVVLFVLFVFGLCLPYCYQWLSILSCPYVTSDCPFLVAPMLPVIVHSWLPLCLPYVTSDCLFLVALMLSVIVHSWLLLCYQWLSTLGCPYVTSDCPFLVAPMLPVIVQSWLSLCYQWLSILDCSFRFL